MYSDGKDAMARKVPPPGDGYVGSLHGIGLMSNARHARAVHCGHDTGRCLGRYYYDGGIRDNHWGTDSGVRTK